jgi:hypothetical protein
MADLTNEQEPNGHGRFSVAEAEGLKLSCSRTFRPMYSGVFHELAKQMLWELHLLFDGKVVDQDGGTHCLDLRLSHELRERARPAFAELWDIITHKEFEDTPLARARGDESFRRFMQRSTSCEDGPVGPLHRHLRVAGRSEAAKRVWLRRKRRK